MTAPQNGQSDEHPQRPPYVDHIQSAPAWAGERGDGLARQTQEQIAVGVDDPRFQHRDPLAQFTDWFGPGDRLTKPALEPSMDGDDPGRVRVFRPSWGKRRLDIDAAARASAPTITFTLDGARTQSMDLGEFDHSLLRSVYPMRDFARRLQQFNKPVAPWLHTVGHHVGAESHHERTLMMVADFHPAVDHISAQPFTLVWPEAGKHLSHTPDIALLGGRSLPLIVDVRTPESAADPEWVAKVPGIRAAVAALGMGYLIWTGMSRPYRLNLENFTEARVPSDSYAVWSDVALALCSEPMTASELADHVDANGYQRLRALMLIRRMLWRRALHTDMFASYGASSVVRCADGQE